MTKARDLSKSTLPSQSGNSGKYLTTDGTAQSWGTVPPAGGLTLISTTAMPTNASTVEITGIPTTYNELVFRFFGLKQEGFGGINYIRFNGDSGSNYASGGESYNNGGTRIFSGNSNYTVGFVFNCASEPGTYSINVYQANESVNHHYEASGTSSNSNGAASAGAGVYKPATGAPITSFTFYSTNGNFTGGDLLVYGVKY